MYIKQLKLLHSLLGLTLMTGYLASEALLTRLYPEIYYSQMSINLLLDSSTILLLAPAIANLLLGTYLTASQYKRHTLQIIGSLLVMASGLAAATVTFGHLTQTTNDLPIALFPLTSMIIGVGAHLLSNLRTFILKPRIMTDNANRETGTVKWFNVSKGFGFIACDEGEDVFVHHRAIRGEGHKTLAEGQRVEFIVMQRDKGLQAEDVISVPS